MTTESPNHVTYTECYVAFLDLLGVRALVKKTDNDPALYHALVKALTETKNTSTFSHEEQNVITSETKTWTLQVQAFSDCVVLFIPIETKMLSWLLASIRRLWDQMIRQGVSLRGAITIGGMHWDSQWSASVTGNHPDATDEDIRESTPIAFGPGLVEAYKLENECAVYPRILISNSLYDHVERNGSAAIFPLATSPATKLIDLFRQDFDGLWHLDVLHPGIRRRDVLRQAKETDEQGHPVLRNYFDETTREEWLQQFRSFIDTNLAKHEDEKLLAKYQWLARYYNNTPDISKPFRIFKDTLPAGVIPLTCTFREKKTS